MIYTEKELKAMYRDGPRAIIENVGKGGAVEYVQWRSMTNPNGMVLVHITISARNSTIRRILE